LFATNQIVLSGIVTEAVGNLNRNFAEEVCRYSSSWRSGPENGARPERKRPCAEAGRFLGSGDGVGDLLEKGDSCLLG
jgi:hypothetical protein